MGVPGRGSFGDGAVCDGHRPPLHLGRMSCSHTGLFIHALPSPRGRRERVPDRVWKGYPEGYGKGTPKGMERVSIGYPEGYP